VRVLRTEETGGTRNIPAGNLRLAAWCNPVGDRLELQPGIHNTTFRLVWSAAIKRNSLAMRLGPPGSRMCGSFASFGSRNPGKPVKVGIRRVTGMGRGRRRWGSP
jgi:hypothetical protein